jgi:DNA-binding CsgD family transcriptional regulator
MKRTMIGTAGLLCYLAFVGLLFDYNWILLIKPKPFLSILIGMAILTATQYEKGSIREDVYVSLKWNLMFASFLTTLMTAFSSLSSAALAAFDSRNIAEALLPLIYGSMLYLLLEIVFRTSREVKAREAAEAEAAISEMTSAIVAEQVFRELELTNRECHVALKLLGSMSNKEIAAQLYISEATVKKHIQNIYQKFGATDRTSFREFYYQKARQK